MDYDDVIKCNIIINTEYYCINIIYLLYKKKIVEELE